MRAKLPLIGDIRTGKDAAEQPVIKTVKVKKDKSIVGGVVELYGKGLTNDKGVSEKLIKSFYEWVFANVSVLSEEVSKLSSLLKLYQTNFRGGELVLEELDEHPILDALDKFNETTTSSEGFYMTQAHLELAGDSFWYVQGTGSNIENIFLLQPDKVELDLGDFNKGAKRMVEGYTFKDTVDGKTVKQTYSPEEIIPIKVPNPANQFRGKSVVEAAAKSIDTDILSTEASLKFFENGMIANFALSTDQRLNDTQVKQLQAELRGSRTGIKNAFKVPIFSGGLKPMPLQMTNKESELIQQQEWLRDKIMAMFKNTKSSLGITDDVNRANAEASLSGWKRSVIKPKMQRIVDALNEYLLPRFGENLILGFDDPVPEDRAAKIAEVVELYAKNRSVLTLNEARDLIGFDAVTEDGADQVKQPAPVIPDIPAPVKNVNYVRHFRRIKLHTQLKEYQKAYKKSRVLATKYVESKKKVEAKKPSKRKVNAFRQRVDQIIGTYEEMFSNKALQFIQKVVKEAESNLEKEEARKDGELFDEDKFKLQAQADFAPILSQALAVGGEAANQFLGIEQPYVPKQKEFNSAEFIRRQIDKFAIAILATDRDILASIIATGLEAGESIPQIRRAIQDKFSEFSKTQAERITRTEVARATNTGIVDAYRQSGVVEGKQWLTSGDPCEYCAPLEGKIVELDGNYFDEGDTWQGDAASAMKLDYEDVGEPPLHPNCRCTTISVIEGLDPLIEPSWCLFSYSHKLSTL